MPPYWPKEKREFVDWYSAKPFEIVQMDIKHIRNQKALTREQIIHLDRYRIPNYQWGLLDVNSRFELIGYSEEKRWTNGLCWYLRVISWLRTHGVKSQIVFTVDNGEESGGKSWMKVRELRKLIAGHWEPPPWFSEPAETKLKRLRTSPHAHTSSSNWSSSSLFRSSWSFWEGGPRYTRGPG